MILTGKRIGGKKAEKMGLADTCVPLQLLREHAVRYAQMKKAPRRRMPELSPAGSPPICRSGRRKATSSAGSSSRKKAKEMVDDKTKGFYPASYKALDAVFDGFDMPMAKALELEAALFGQLAVTRESHSLVHLFHATNGLKKHRFKDAGRERFGKRKVETVGIIGSGFMGAGITTVPSSAASASDSRTRTRNRSAAR